MLDKKEVWEKIIDEAFGQAISYIIKQDKGDIADIASWENMTKAVETIKKYINKEWH